MPVREVLRYPHPALKQVAAPAQTGQIEAVGADLIDTMRSFPGCVGIAAPQIGEPARVVVVDVSEHPKAQTSNGLLVLANPRVVEAEGSEVAREGCLSIPDLTANVRRATRVVVEHAGGRVECHGFEARCVAHELDHLDGILFLDRVDSLVSDLFRRKNYTPPDPHCPVCGAPMFGWLQAPAADPGRDERYALERCERCGLGLVADPSQIDLVSLYESGSYAPGRPRLHRLAAPLLAAFDRKRLRLLRAAVPAGGTVLEVGAGRGRFLARLAGAGYDVCGIEPAGHRAAEARELGLAVQAASVETAQVEPGSQDAIVAWHLLEHLADPGAALDRFAEWLRPGGALLVGVPNRRSLQAVIGGEHWFHLDLPRHLHHFSPRSLELALRAHGFEPGRPHHILLEHNQLGMWQTVMNALTFHDHFLYGVLKRSLTPATSRGRAKFAIDALVSALVGPLALLITAPLELGAGLVRRGGTIAVVARRV